VVLYKAEGNSVINTPLQRGVSGGVAFKRFLRLERCEGEIVEAVLGLAQQNRLVEVVY
jgi:hypothetical protein